MSQQESNRPQEGSRQELLNSKVKEKIISQDLIKITSSQLASLATIINESNFDSTFDQIHKICNSSVPEVYYRYITRLLLTSSTLVETNTITNQFVEKLIAKELKYLAENPQYIDRFSNIVSRTDSVLLKQFTLKELFDHFKLDEFEQVSLSLSLANSQDLKAQVKSILEENLSSSINLLKTKNTNQTLVFFTSFFGSQLPSVYQKLLTFSSLLEFLAQASSEYPGLELAISKFFKSLSEMKFQEILATLMPEHIVPERLLNDLLSIQSQEDLDDALALLLSEILYPGSQNLANTPGLTALTPQNVPEASAKGSQFGSIIRKLPKQPTWNVIFSKMLSRLVNPVITQESLSELLSAFDDSTIDAFLEYQWPNDFKINLYISLRQLNPSLGAFDLLRTNYLKPIVSDLSYPNLKNSVLYYYNVTKLELDCISNSGAIENIEHKRFLHQIFEEDIRTAPELIALGCLQYSPPSPTIDDLLENLVVHLLDGSSSYYPLILKTLDQKDQLLKIVGKLITNKVSINDQIMAYLVSSDLISGYLESVDLANGLDLAVLSVKAGWEGFSSYLFKKKRDSSFNDVLLSYLRVQSSIDESKTNNQKTTSLKAIFTLLETVAKQDLSETQFQEFQSIQSQTLQAFPRLINFGFGHDDVILANGDVNTFPFDVEQQMKVFYQRMYNHEIDIKDVITMLSELRESNVPRDQDVFACMIHSLLDEYRFFPEYPLNALAITSVLFGSMIYFQLIRGTALTIALRYILDSCNQSPDSNMFKFAVQALYAFRQRLQEFPNYCSALSEVDSLKSQPQIYQIIINAVNNKSSGGDVPLNQTQKQQQIFASNTTAAAGGSEAKPKIFKSITAQVLFPNNITQEQPRQEVSQRILFLVNNMSDENLLSKAKEIQALLSPSIFHWFATYLVGQRAKTEPNNHVLYGSLVDVISNDLFVEYVTSVTLEEVSDLLNDSEETPSERSYLKNLGSWLGRITLGRNRPLKHRNLSLKDLLLEASEASKLALVIPFVCKILDQTKGSEVFEHPNPWTIGVLRVLAELYEYASLKLNLRFEIEVLCNSLKIDLKDLEPTLFIRTHGLPDPKATLSDGVVNMNLNDTTAPGLPQFTQPTNLPDAQQQVPTRDPGSLMNQPQVQQQQQQQIIPPQLGPQVAQPQQQINEALFQHLLGSTSFVTHPNLKRLFIMALTKSIREILPPAVERAVSIAVTTARSLILKDFATEVDELKLRSAAYTLVRRLAEGLALATCRDPLKENIQTTVQSFAPQLLNVENSPFEELPQAINDNIDLACSFVENAAMDKAVKEIDEVLVASIAARRQHQERRTDQPFYSQYLSRYSVQLPEPLGLKPTGVTPRQYQVYDAFGKHELTSPNAVTTQVIQPQLEAQALAPTSSVNNVNQQQQSQQPITIEQTFAYLQSLVDSLLKAIADVEGTKLDDIPSDSPIRLIITQIFSLTARNLAGESLMLKIAQFIVNALFTTSESDLSVEVFVFLLEKICTISVSTRKDVCWWLIHASDERKFNSKVMFTLLKAGLISASDLDRPLSKSITKENKNSIDFAIKLIKESVSSENSVAFRSDFALTVDVLRDIKDNENIVEFLNFLEKEPTSLVNNEVSESDRMGYVFTEWIRLLQHEPKNEKLHIVFIHQMVKSGILNKPESMTLFFRNAVEISVAFFKESDPVSDVFLSTDALSKLIVKLLILQQESEISRSNYFKLILSIISLVFANDHENSQSEFNERPYFRIFSTLLSEWSIVATDSHDLDDFNTSFYLILADFFNAYQPLAFPGFAFAWVTLISHRMFLPNIIESNHPKAQGKFVLLLLDLLRFETKYIKSKDMPEVISVIYKGTLRIFLLLLHDYPEILVQHHYQLCCEIPQSFVQLRNIVLSAFPKSISMPDPFTQGLKVDRLPEITEAPVISYNPSNDLRSLKKPVDGYLRIPSNMLLKTIINGIKQTPVEEAGIGYSKSNFNVKAINAIVLYVGIQAVNDRQPNGQTFNPKSSHFALLSGLMQEGTVEFQYHLIEAICNQLRYPNSHTQWFSYIILHFFGAQSLWNGKKSQVQQIITRVLLERVICNRPHPWGLLITFTELLKNTELAFFDLDFTKSAPELENIFGSLLRHIGSNSKSVAPAVASA